MDLSKAINTKRVFSKDAFQPGKAYRIKIHDADKMAKMINASDYDDDDFISYTRHIEGLFKQFDTNGFDAICGTLEDDCAVFVSSYFGKLSKKIMTFEIKIDIDTFYDFAKSDELRLAPDVEIFDTGAILPKSENPCLVGGFNNPSARKRSEDMMTRFLRGDFCGGIQDDNSPTTDERGS